MAVSKWQLTLIGHDSPTVGGSTVAHEVTLQVFSVQPLYELPEGPGESVDGFFNRTGGGKRGWQVKVWEFRNTDSGEWTAADRRMMYAALHQPYITITDTNATTMVEFYQALTGFDAGELTEYGFTDILAGGLPVVRGSISATLDEETGTTADIIELWESAYLQQGA